MGLPPTNSHTTGIWFTTGCTTATPSSISAEPFLPFSMYTSLEVLLLSDPLLDSLSRTQFVGTRVDPQIWSLSETAVAFDN